MEALLALALDLLTRHHLLMTFLGAFFFGEGVIITASYLSEGLGWNIAGVAAAAFLGTLIADTAWFGLGKILHDSFPVRWQRERDRAEKLIHALTGERPFLALLFIKFLYGSRIIMILYLAARRVPLRLFVLYDALGTSLWLAVMITLGVLAGKGLGNAESIVSIVQMAVAVFVASIILFRLFALWLTKKIEQSE